MSFEKSPKDAVTRVKTLRPPVRAGQLHGEVRGEITVRGVGGPLDLDRRLAGIVGEGRQVAGFDRRGPRALDGGAGLAAKRVVGQGVVLLGSRAVRAAPIVPADGGPVGTTLDRTVMVRGRNGIGTAGAERAGGVESRAIRQY